MLVFQYQPTDSHRIQSQLLCLCTYLGLSIALSLNKITQSRQPVCPTTPGYVANYSHPVCPTHRGCRSATQTVYQPLVRSLQRAQSFGLSLYQSVTSLSYHDKSCAVHVVVALSLELVGYQYDTHYHDICSNFSLYHSLYGILGLTMLTCRAACHRSLLTSGWRGVPYG